MNVRTRNAINRLDQTVTVNGSRDDRLWCSHISLGSHCGMTEAEFEIPELLFDELEEDLREAFVRVSADGSGDEHFCGYLSVSSATLNPKTDMVHLRAYSFTRWLTKVHVGQFTNQWEVRYWVKDPRTGQPTGWTPALILQHLFSQLPEIHLQRIGLGDLRVLTDVVDVPTPDITFRLTDYAAAINQVLAYAGDVAFRERFEQDKVFLDFYRMTDVQGVQAVLECCKWTNPNRSKANVQELNGVEDGTDLVTRVIGIGAYRQFMVTCRSKVEGLDAISEMDENVQLEDDWDPDLEELVLKSPGLATSSTGYSATVAEAVTGEATVIKIAVDLGLVPVGAIVSSDSTKELMLVTAFTPAVPADSEAEPPVAAQPATITVTRGYKDTDAGALAVKAVLHIKVPGIEKVFRDYKLPKVLNGLAIMKNGCLKDTTNHPYPQYQAFIYKAKVLIQHDDPVPPATVGPMWLDGQVLTDQDPVIEKSLKFDVERRRITFAAPTVTLDYDKPDPSNNKKRQVKYQRTVCGITFTVENREYPFFFDTGAVQKATGFDFDAIGLTERWQKGDLHSWRLGTMDMPIRGVSFPCLYFGLERKVDELGNVTQTVGQAHFYAAGTGVVARSDYDTLKALSEQILRERCRRGRSWRVTVPWFSPGFYVGQRVTIAGVANFPRDVFKITSVAHELPLKGDHQTTLTIDNIKPPVRHRVRGGR